MIIPLDFKRVNGETMKNKHAEDTLTRIFRQINFRLTFSKSGEDSYHLATGFSSPVSYEYGNVFHDAVNVGFYRSSNSWMEVELVSRGARHTLSVNRDYFETKVKYKKVERGDTNIFLEGSADEIIGQIAQHLSPANR